MSAVPFSSDEHLAPGVKEFLTVVNGGGSMGALSVSASRQGLADLQKAFTVDYSGIEESDKEVVADGFTLKLNVVRASGLKGELPGFIFVHGGGWVLGDYPTHRRLVRDLVIGSGCAAVFVNYTLSPEAHYPQAIHEIYAATKWVASHGKEIGVDGGKLAIVGNSAGGNMAGATSFMARERKGPLLRLQILMWPATDASFTEESYAEFGADRFLTTPLMG
jgi:acetyl esterase